MGKRSLYVISYRYLLCLVADYQWESTTPIKGEKRSSANLEAAYSSALIKLAINVSPISRISIFRIHYQAI